MTDNFYRAFEEKYRGSRELVKSRLEAYQPFLEPLLEVSPAAVAVDLGCGRGEWLEYVSSLGFSATGVDLDEGMLSACKELGLSARKGDLLSYLRSIDKDSVSLVSSFHVVEHIAFHDLRLLVAEAFRVLKPGGLLIMETPNSENIVVGTRTFYLDPTHRQPIPAELLSFVAEHSGFERIKTLGLQEPQGISSKTDPGLWDVLSGVSPDYAVIAQKAGDSAEMAAFDGAFESEFGIGLDRLATLFDDSRSALREQVDLAVSESRSAQEVASRAQEAANSVQEFVLEVETRLAAEAAKNEAMKSSTSWKITAPLRYIGRYLKKLMLLNSLFQPFKVFLRHFALYIGRRPSLKRKVARFLNKFPRLKSRLLLIVGGVRVVPPETNQHSLTKLSHLTPRAKRIHDDLKVKVDERISREHQ